MTAGPIPVLRIRRLDPASLGIIGAADEAMLYERIGYELWLFLDHGGGTQTLLDERWAIGHRPKDDWWGMVALSADTHEGAVVRLAVEALYASVAIAQLKRERAS